MTQGVVKKSKATTAPRRPNNPGQKKGPRVIAPKKASLMKKQKMNKKLSAGLIEKTERTLAHRAGHLEMLKGGKKDRKEADGAKAKSK
ncbi:MAG: hypothetical protein MMC23_002563 [Stictis urceolatum]|nr:hypothetical protein [Stictis urceolata]